MKNPTEVNDAGELIATLAMASFNQATYTTNQLIEGYRRGQYEAEARFDLASAAIERLLELPYAPSERAIRMAMYPDERRVQAIVNARMEDQ